MEETRAKRRYQFMGSSIPFGTGAAALMPPGGCTVPVEASSLAEAEIVALDVIEVQLREMEPTPGLKMFLVTGAIVLVDDLMLPATTENIKPVAVKLFFEPTREKMLMPAPRPAILGADGLPLGVKP
jgi:hypothetical protein